MPALPAAPQAHLVKLYTSDGGVKLLRRKCVHTCAAASRPRPCAAAGWLPPSAARELAARPAALWRMMPYNCASPTWRRSGDVERQIRLNVGKLPVAYRTEPDGRHAPLLCCCVLCCAALVHAARRVRCSVSGAVGSAYRVPACPREWPAHPHGPPHALPDAPCCAFSPCPLGCRYLYVLDGALTTYTAGEGGDGKPPVPPCILKVGPSKTQVRPRHRLQPGCCWGAAAEVPPPLPLGGCRCCWQARARVKRRLPALFSTVLLLSSPPWRRWRWRWTTAASSASSCASLQTLCACRSAS